MSIGLGNPCVNLSFVAIFREKAVLSADYMLRSSAYSIVKISPVCSRVRISGQMFHSSFVISICCSPNSPASLHFLCFSNSNLKTKQPLFQFEFTFSLSYPHHRYLSQSFLYHLFFVSMYFACIYILPCFLYKVTFRLMRTAVFFKKHIKAFVILLNV